MRDPHAWRDVPCEQCPDDRASAKRWAEQPIERRRRVEVLGHEVELQRVHCTCAQHGDTKREGHHAHDWVACGKCQPLPELLQHVTSLSLLLMARRRGVYRA